jgi:hypothetical protein
MIIATSSPKKWKIGAELIKWYQGTQYAHILLIKDNLVFQASHGSVNCMYIDVFLENNKIIKTFEITEDKIDMDFVYKQLGKPYSIRQILEIAFKFITNIKILSSNGNDQFICSEFVGKALRLDWVNDLTTPLEVVKYLESITQ